MILTKGSIISEYYTLNYNFEVSEYYYFFITAYHTNKRDWYYADDMRISIPKSYVAILEGLELEIVKLLYSIE
jgi:hypothetical protein